MYTVTTNSGHIISTHSTRKKALSHAKRLVFKDGTYSQTKVSYKFRGADVARIYTLPTASL